MSASTNPRAQKRLREQEKVLRRQQRADLGAVLGSEAGRRFLYDVLYRRCGLVGDSFTGHTAHDARASGRRSIGVELAGDAQEHHPKLYLQMQTEAISRGQLEAEQRRAAEATPDPEAEASTTEEQEDGG